MKANELRIGNLVGVFCGVDDEGAYYERMFVTAIGMQLGAYGVWVDTSISSCSGVFMKMDEIKPIPLTEDILLKAGFTKSERDGYYYYNSMLVTYKRFEFFGLVGASLSFREIKYVHELQNRIYDLLGEELNIEL